MDGPGIAGRPHAHSGARGTAGDTRRAIAFERTGPADHGGRRTAAGTAAAGIYALSDFRTEYERSQQNPGSQRSDGSCAPVSGRPEAAGARAMKMRKGHLSDDCLIEVCLDEGSFASERQHLDACPVCAERGAHLVHMLTEVTTVTVAETDAVFGPDRLAKQRARILQRL